MSSAAAEALLPMIHTIVRAADMRKAEGITAVRVEHLTVSTDYFVCLVGNSRPQNMAIAAAIKDAVEAEHGRVGRTEGTADSGWILVDYGDVIVNIMTPRSREYYDIESFWKGGVSVDVSGSLTPGGAPGQGEYDAEADLQFRTDLDAPDELLEAEAALLLEDDAAVGASGAVVGEATAAADPFWALDDDAPVAPAPRGRKTAAKKAPPAPKDEEDPFWS
jgi:ribosome-associated protein